jgi:hypothetical protein
VSGVGKMQKCSDRSADQLVSKPRVVGTSSMVPVRHEEVEAGLHRGADDAGHPEVAIHSVRVWVKYGMTVSQVAEVYEVAARIAGMREATDRSAVPLVPLSHGAPPSIPTLKKQRSRLSRDCVTAAGGMSSRSIRSLRRRAARERWSSSTLGTLSLQRLVVIMAPSTARPPPMKAGDGATSSSPIPEDV